MPFAFFKAVEETVRETLRQGLHGWQVTDCTVTMTHSGYCAAAEPRRTAPSTRACPAPPATSGNLTPLVLMTALRRAGTRCYEPMHRFRLEVPADTLGALLPALARLRRRPTRRTARGRDVPCWRARSRRRGCTSCEQQLPGLTRGEGVLESRLRPLPAGAAARPPTRPRTDHNPLDRKEYLLHVLRRV